MIILPRWNLMEKIKKYLLLLFLIENITAQTTSVSSFTGFLFYVFLALGWLTVFDSNTFARITLKKFSWMYFLMVLYIVFQLFISPQKFEPYGLLYVISKIATFLIIITSISSDCDFYEQKLPVILAYVIAFFIILGSITGGFQSGEGRHDLGFSNSNTTGSWGAIMVGCVLFHTQTNKWNWKSYLCVLVGAFAILASGSRASLLMIALLIFFRYGVSYKTVIFGFLFLVFAFYILPFIGLDPIGIDRVVGTVDGTVDMDRERNREAAIWMIQQKSLTGWGFGAKNQGFALSLSELGSHNGYLETCKYMGIPASVFWFLAVVVSTLSYLKTKRQYKIQMDLYFSLVLILFAKSMYESLFVGIHEFETNVFFVALAMLSTRKYNYIYGSKY